MRAPAASIAPCREGVGLLLGLLLRLRPGLLVGLVLCAALASPSAVAQEAGGCGKDTDCKGSRVCIKRVCVEPPLVRSCGKDTDCPGDEVCDGKKCMLPKPKAAGKGNFKFFAPEMHEAARERQLMESDLRVALEKGQLRVVPLDSRLSTVDYQRFASALRAAPDTSASSSSSSDLR